MRLFVAADLSQDQLSQLRVLVDQAKAAAPFDYIRWLPDENWHATMAFLGERPAENLEQIQLTIEACLEGVAQLEALPARIQGFPHRSHPRLLAFKMHPGPGLQQLHWKLGQQLGIKDRQRDFRMHVSVARFRELDSEDARSLQDAIRALANAEPSPWNLPSVTLYQSTLKQSGATYGIVKRWLLP